ncbi:glycerol kinase [Salmonella enterica subsp. enterica]|uniref:Glycerol kinase n=1 Tax=Salmonella enterica I TaxID=59201 RepID=A0A379UZD2_SALET|nr:glycerol kinase [Salmonella enterica subsp. enterica]
MTEKKYIVALDQGTTSSRAVVMDHDANIVSVSQREFEQIYPKPGWVEHDPMEIWASQSSTLVEVLAKADISSDQIAAIVSPTNVKPRSSGNVKPANRYTTLLSGSAVVPPIFANSLNATPGRLHPRQYRSGRRPVLLWH